MQCPRHRRDKHARGPGVRGRCSGCRPGHCTPTKVSPQMSDLCELQKGCPFTLFCSLPGTSPGAQPNRKHCKEAMWESCSILARLSLPEAPQAARLQCGERCAKASRSSLAAPSQASPVNVCTFRGRSPSAPHVHRPGEIFGIPR